MQNHTAAGIYQVSRRGIWEDLHHPAEDTVARMPATEILLPSLQQRQATKASQPQISPDFTREEIGKQLQSKAGFSLCHQAVCSEKERNENLLKQRE